MKILIILLIGLILLSGCTFNRKSECYKESIELWESVNADYPHTMTQQESYDKNNRQACASMYYVVCMNGDKLHCSPTLNENKEMIV